MPQSQGGKKEWSHTYQLSAQKECTLSKTSPNISKEYYEKLYRQQRMYEQEASGTIEKGRQ